MLGAKRLGADRFGGETTWGRIDLGAKRLGANRLGGETTCIQMKSGVYKVLISQTEYGQNIVFFEDASFFHPFD